ncbi:hypothetical protein [Chitinophaga sp. 22620]|uniref:hypothetical protein n=1 Tax=Chitinophaga sp. 22620 TaxID=3453952 RepID=UPI003F843755
MRTFACAFQRNRPPVPVQHIVEGLPLPDFAPAHIDAPAPRQDHFFRARPKIAELV